MQFNQPDTLIPDPSNPLDWNRYSYARYNPLKYVDPTGHDPEWLDYLQGAAYQFANDMTGGGVDSLAASFGVLCMDCNASDKYRQGQQAGRVASTVLASAEQVLGAAAAGAAIAAGAATVGGGAACTVISAGVCALPAGGLLAAEAAAAVAGGVAYANGSAVVAFAKNNPIGNTPRTPSEIQKSIASLEQRIAEHEAKLKSYIEDPYANDNLGLLRRAPNDEIRERIINTRINHLQHEIDNWRRQVDSLRRLLDN